MRNFTETHHNVNINVTEKRAPTDESVKLLNEFQKEALENLICKISNDENNTFKWEGYFFRTFNPDSITPTGIFYLRLTVNGQLFERKVKTTTQIMSMLIKHGNLRYIDLEGDVKRYVFLQICILVSEILLNDSETAKKIITEMAEIPVTNFDYKTLMKTK